MRIKGLQDGLRGDTGLATVDFLLFHLAQIFPMTHQRLQFPLFGRRRCPGVELLAATEIGNQGGIASVSLVFIYYMV